MNRSLPIFASLILLAAALACSKADDLNVVESDFILQGTMTLGEMDREKIQCSVIDPEGYRVPANAFTLSESGAFSFVVPTRYLIKKLSDSEIIRLTTFTEETPSLKDLANKHHLEKPIAIIRYECAYNPSETKIGKILYHQNFAVIAKNSIWKGGSLELGKMEFSEVGIAHVTVSDENKKPVASAQVTPLSYVNDSTLQLWQDPMFGPVFEKSDKLGEAVLFPIGLSEKTTAKAEQKQFQILVKHESYCLFSTIPQNFASDSEATISINLKPVKQCPKSALPGALSASFAEGIVVGKVGTRDVGFINDTTFELSIEASNEMLRPFDVSIYKGFSPSEATLISTERISGFISKVSLRLPSGMIAGEEATDFSVSLKSILSAEEIASVGESPLLTLYGQYLIQEVSVDASLVKIIGPGGRSKILSGLSESTFKISYSKCPESGSIGLLDSSDSSDENINFVKCSKDGTEYKKGKLEILKNPGIGGFRDLVLLIRDKYGNVSDRSDANASVFSVYFDYGMPDLNIAGIVSDASITNLGGLGVAEKTAIKGSNASPYVFSSTLFLSAENVANHVLRFDRPGSCKLSSQSIEDGSGISDLGHHVQSFTIGKTEKSAEAIVNLTACGDDMTLSADLFSIPEDDTEAVTFYLKVKDLAGQASAPARHEIYSCYKDGASIVGTQLCWCYHPSGASCLAN